MRRQLPLRATLQRSADLGPCGRGVRKPSSERIDCVRRVSRIDRDRRDRRAERRFGPGRLEFGRAGISFERVRPMALSPRRDGGQHQRCEMVRARGEAGQRPALGVGWLRLAQRDRRHQLLDAGVLRPAPQQSLGHLDSLGVCAIGERLQGVRQARSRDPSPPACRGPETSDELGASVLSVYSRQRQSPGGPVYWTHFSEPWRAIRPARCG